MSCGLLRGLELAAQFDHLRRLSRIVRSKTTSAPLSTLIVARPGRSIWIEPAGAAWSWHIGAGCSTPAWQLAVQTPHRQQGCSVFASHRQLTVEAGPPPPKHLVRVDTLRLGHTGYARPRLKCQLHNPTLLCSRPLNANPAADFAVLFSHLVII